MDWVDNSEEEEHAYPQKETMDDRHKKTSFQEVFLYPHPLSVSLIHPFDIGIIFNQLHRSSRQLGQWHDSKPIYP